jgi:hypothetical protein
MVKCPIQLRPFTEADRTALKPWFPLAYAGAFIDDARRGDISTSPLR